jgi:putative transposase
MLKAYKTEIKLSDEQEIIVHKTIGVSRFVYNLYLNYVEKRGFISGYDFSKYLNNIYMKEHPEQSWIKEVSSKSVKQSIMNVHKAYKRCFAKIARKPRKKKRIDNVKMYFVKNNNLDCTIERHRIKIPTLGFVRLKEYGYLPINSKVKSGTIERKSNKYFVSVIVEEESKLLPKTPYSEGIGIDVGIKDFVITSNNLIFKNINKSEKIKKYEKKLKRKQRSYSKKLFYYKKKHKNNIEGKERLTNSNLERNRLEIQKLHYRLSEMRKGYVKTVVNSLVKLNPKFITIEDLNVKGMLKNRHLSKSISNQNFSFFFMFLGSQCKKHGIEVRRVGRFYPSSKLCSCCGSKKVNLKLKDRIYNCSICGFEIDRDLNASLNLRDCKEFDTVG